MIVYIHDTVREMKNLLGNRNIFRIGLLLEKGLLFQNLPVISYIDSWCNHNFSREDSKCIHVTEKNLLTKPVFLPEISNF